MLTIGVVGAFIIVTSSIVFATVMGFIDVAQDSWYADSVNSLREKGILSGYSDGSFKPNKAVTRAEMATALDRVLKYLEGDLGDYQYSHFDENSENNEITLSSDILLDVPFTSQAPFGDWDMPYQEACEEASIIMVEYYLRNESLSAEQANEEIIALTGYLEKNGYHIDINIQETKTLFKEYYDREGEIFYDEDVNIEKIKELLVDEHPIIIPAAGRLLGNPNFTGEGPPYHMLVIIGYDENGFITNDPGTRLGAKYHYNYETIMLAIHDWTGSKNTVTGGRKAMLVL